jgi:predicted amidophosphoribosyltransferase
VRDTKPQTSLKKKERKKNLQGAYVYVADPHLPVAGKHLILIDDVTTTGTTLAEAKWALKRANPASILCVAIAH